jgi:anti-sigma-K factor RskA
VRSGDLAVVRVDRLPRLGASRVYQLWVRRDEDVRPSSVFVVNRDGRASAAIPSGVAGADEVMVSEEPDGGSPQPTGEPLLRLRLR